MGSWVVAAIGALTAAFGVGLRVKIGKDGIDTEVIEGRKKIAWSAVGVGMIVLAAGGVISIASVKDSTNAASVGADISNLSGSSSSPPSVSATSQRTTAALPTLSANAPKTPTAPAGCWEAVQALQAYNTGASAPSTSALNTEILGMANDLDTAASHATDYNVRVAISKIAADFRASVTVLQAGDPNGSEAILNRIKGSDFTALGTACVAQ